MHGGVYEVRCAVLSFCILYFCHLSLHHCLFNLVTQSQEPVQSGVYDVRCEWFRFICIVNSISGWGLYSDAIAFILAIFLPCRGTWVRLYKYLGSWQYVILQTGTFYPFPYFRGTWKFRPGTGLNCTIAVVCRMI